MNISKWLGVGLFLLAMPLIVQSSEAITPEKALKEAQDYIIVKPSHSYQLLFQPHDISPHLMIKPSLALTVPFGFGFAPPGIELGKPLRSGVSTMVA